jgi:hypothetical protein
MDVLAISGSTSRGSVNTRLARLDGELLPSDAVNAVGWLSRPHGRSVLRDKPMLVLSA